jgi:hypothetical protein
MLKKKLVKIVSSAVVLALASNFGTLTASASVQNNSKNQSNVGVKSKVISKNGDKAIVEVTNKETNEKAYVVSLKKEVMNTNSKIGTDKSILKSLEKLDGQAKVDFLNKSEVSKKIENSIAVGTRTEFQIVNTEEKANALTVSLASSNFWHSSYVEDYTSKLGHGYHIHFSSTDTSYVTNMGWVAADGVAAALAEAGVLTGGIAIIVGAVATGAILTVSWAEANSDGSIDIWSPDATRNQNGSTLVKIGSRWYFI